MPPSLLQVNTIIPRPGYSKSLIQKLKKTKALDFIVEWVKDRLVEYGAKPAKSVNDRILIVRARTGSGKSTAMPVELYRLFNPNVPETYGELKKGLLGTYTGGNIICTQPRVLTAIDIPTELADNEQSPWASDMVLGQTIGFSTGSSKQLCSNCLIYATLDTLLVQLRTKTDQQLMEMYRMIILDEVHERSITFDMVIMLLKQFIHRIYKDAKCPIVIFTSATFDVEKYANYLGVNINTNIIDVEGNVYHTTDIYLQSDTSNYIKTAAEIIDRIHNHNENPKPQEQGDILVFLPGGGEMKKLKEEVIKKMDKSNPFMFSILQRKTVSSSSAFRDLKLPYSELRVDNMGEYNSKSELIATRRIFMGTTVAETGLTISTLGYVIDSGLLNNKECYFPNGISGVVTKPEAKSRSTQRRGRVGRKFDGFAYYLFTESTFTSLTNIQYPDIIYQDMNREFMALVKTKLDIMKLDMLDNPPVDSLKHALTTNIVLGYYDNDSCTLTETGKLLMDTQYITLEGFRIVQSGYAYDVSIPDLITIIAMQGWRVPRPTKYKPREILNEILPAFFFDPSASDFVIFFRMLTLDQFIEYMFYYDAFVLKTKLGIDETKKWCNDIGLSFDGMIELTEKRLEIMEDLVKMGFNPLYNQSNSLKTSNQSNYFTRLCNIKQCLYDGYKLNLIKWDAEEMRYFNRFHNHIKVKPLDSRITPHLILTDDVMIEGDFDSYKKTLGPSRITILDGYIGIGI